MELYWLRVSKIHYLVSVSSVAESTSVHEEDIGEEAHGSLGGWSNCRLGPDLEHSMEIGSLSTSHEPAQQSMVIYLWWYTSRLQGFKHAYM